MTQALAIKYRPASFSEVTEQGAIKTILENQIASNDIKHAYLFCGPAGCGKTTCARIFANEINHYNGSPIELDAASNNGVDDVRNIIAGAKTKSINSEYKIYIIDECHSLSSSAWQAMLKLLEEPPEKTVFILCTTDPQKIPRTILSRVQRFDFKKISQKGIIERLDWVLAQEVKEGNLPEGDHQELDAIQYIAKLADGGMRDSLTLLDKCLDYTKELTIESVVEALGTVDYSVMFSLTEAINNGDKETVVNTIENLYNDGKDLKQFVHQYMEFLLDLEKYDCTGTFSLLSMPATYEEQMKLLDENIFVLGLHLLEVTIKLNADIKYVSSPKALVVSTYLLEAVKCMDKND